MQWDTIKNYLTQPSTWKGIIYLSGALGLLTISPEVQDALIEKILLIVTGLFSVSGLIDIIKNERSKTETK